MFSNAPINTHELKAKTGQLLPSQREYVFSPERFSMLAGGFASGKTHAMILKGLVLSAVIPGNVGMVLRYHYTDLEESTMRTFFDICPPSWIKAFNKKARTVLLRNGSLIFFRHLHDAKALTKTRRLGANLGWFAIDQAEEIQLEHWQAMMSRLRLPRAPKKFGFGTMNPAGHDWLWETFFSQFKPWPRDKEKKALPIDGKYYQAFRGPDTLGIAVNSEENRESAGGFIEDSYFDSNLKQWGREWVERYVYCSFDDFTGKIYREFEGGLRNEDYRSVHIVDPFPIPKHWPLTVGIDVGGDSPWAVVPEYTDDAGNQIIVRGFSKRTGRTGEVAQWIKNNLPWNESRTQYVMDWENKVAMVELGQDHGIHAQIARKEVIPGILQTNAYFHVQKHRALPEWYQDTQPNARYQKFRNAGSPRTFVFNTFTEFIQEHDAYKWDPNKADKPLKTATARYDTCFAQGTNILMGDGTQKRIERICAGDFVMTRFGSKRVLSTGMTNSYAEVFRAEFSNGTEIVATAEHPFWSVNAGLLTLNTLRYSDILQEWNPEQLSTTALSGTSTKGIRTIEPSSTARRLNSMCISGRNTMAQFLQDMWFITKMRTNEIGNWVTWNVSRLGSMQRNVIPLISISHGAPPLAGTNLWLVGDGILCTGSGYGNKECSNIGFVDTAKNSFPPNTTVKNSVPTTANQHGGESLVWTTLKEGASSAASRLWSTVTQKSARAKVPVRLVSLSKAVPRPVYNLAVEDVHEYFANGLLVRNCDAHRYVCMTRPIPGKWEEPERDWDSIAKKDPLSYRAMRDMDKRIAEREWRRKGGAALREADMEDAPDVDLRGDEKFDWAGQGEV